MQTQKIQGEGSCNERFFPNESPINSPLEKEFSGKLKCSRQITDRIFLEEGESEKTLFYEVSSQIPDECTR